MTKAWTAIDRLSIIWKSDLTDKMKRSFFHAAVVLILLYGCTTWTLTKRLEKKLDGNYKRMLRAVFNMSWRQHPTRHKLYGHLPPPITKTIHSLYGIKIKNKENYQCLGANKTAGEGARRQLHKNAVSNTHKAIIWPPTSHHENYTS